MCMEKLGFTKAYAVITQLLYKLYRHSLVTAASYEISSVVHSVRETQLNVTFIINDCLYLAGQSFAAVPDASELNSTPQGML